MPAYYTHRVVNNSEARFIKELYTDFQFDIMPGKGEEYQLWPDAPDLVRIAAKANATIVPFSGVGSDEHLGLCM